MASTSQDQFEVIEARPSDIESLTTILARSFHPVNPYIRKTLPDTPAVRTWWRQLLEDQRQNPDCHLLTAADTATETSIGILVLRLLGADERGAGFWTKFDWPSDINENMLQAMIDPMVENREKFMLGRPHFLIELFGADHTWKGKGVGKAMLERACQAADHDGHDIFVQANASAKGFYERVGFEIIDVKVMPGEDEYTEYALVRRHRNT